ncbi:MAG: tRNA 2-thiouridine(34) synthase MnmA [Oscillospiraceae bacterium]|nr:tRNA 2-thiouridine(34) synthase MnmA [Oscillospiraceae bacterium]
MNFTNTQRDTAIGQMPKSALIAMSGGVDSTVSAMLMIRAGLDCAGAIMKLHPCVKDAEPDARACAEKLGIPFYSLDFSAGFAEQVIGRFVTAYQEGRTPNPCVDCNRNIKFGRLLEEALELGKDCLVTGHYARIEQGADGRYLLRKATDLTKDQSYVLYSLKQHQFANIRFPLGGHTKQEVRKLAREAGLAVADRKESQDICFVPDGDYARFIAEHTGQKPAKGRFVDTQGNDLGESKGIVHYTIGQRRGLGLAMSHPPYVVKLNPEDNTIVVGKDEMLYSKTLEVQNINLIPYDRLDTPLKAWVKIRYKQVEQPATVRQTGNDSLIIEFDKPQRAITSGQAAVIYDGDFVLGGGTIK